MSHMDQEIVYLFFIFQFAGVYIFKVFLYNHLNFIGVCCNIPTPSLILLICIFLFLLLANLARSLSILLIFSKHQFFVLLIYCFLVSNSVISTVIFTISFHLLLFGLTCSYLSESLESIIRLFI
jgi:hypothetical protein